MNHKTLLLITGGLIVLVVVVYILLSNTSTPKPAQTIQPAIERASSPSGETETSQIEVTGSDFKFNPTQISLKSSEKVKLVFKNMGEARHDFVIEGLNTKTKIIAPGTSDTLEFKAPDTGSYTFYCSVPGHREAGMIGTLKVD